MNSADQELLGTIPVCVKDTVLIRADKIGVVPDGFYWLSDGPRRVPSITELSPVSEGNAVYKPLMELRNDIIQGSIDDKPLPPGVLTDRLDKAAAMILVSLSGNRDMIPTREEWEARQR